MRGLGRCPWVVGFVAVAACTNGSAASIGDEFEAIGSAERPADPAVVEMPPVSDTAAATATSTTTTTSTTAATSITEAITGAVAGDGAYAAAVIDVDGRLGLIDEFEYQGQQHGSCATPGSSSTRSRHRIAPRR